MYLVNEQDDLSVTFRYFFHYRFQALFKFTFILCTGNQLSHIQCIDDFAAQAIRHITVNDTMCQTLYNSSFTHTRLPDQDRIIF
ncbi:hypothetical protein FQZ97_890330 [compost metagenome]